MKNLSYFSPFPPLRTGISDYSDDLTKELSSYFNVIAYVDDNYNPVKRDFFDVKNYKLFNNNSPVIYNIGNSEDHAYIYNTLISKKGIVLLHDFNLSGLNFSMLGRFWPKNIFLKEVFLNHGIRAVIDYLRINELNKAKRRLEETLSKNSFLKRGWNQLEEHDGVKFRWTRNRAEFQIKDKAIKEIMLRVYSEFPARVSLMKEKFKITPDQYQWISRKIKPRDVVVGKINVFKPKSHFSKKIHKEKRQLGIRVSEIKYASENGYGSLDISSDPIIFKDFKKYIEKQKRDIIKVGKIKNRINSQYFLNKKVINSAKALIVHSDYLRDVVKKINKIVPVKVIRHGAYINRPDISKSEMRVRLGLKHDFIVCSFGKIQEHKRIGKALEAFSVFNKKTPNSIYIIIGESDKTFNLNKAVEKYSLEKKVMQLGYLDFNKAIEYIYASDVCINLRYPSTGATSGSLIRSLSVGTPCLISDLPENRQFPETCVLKIKEKVEDIVDALNYLKNRSISEKMSDSAVEYIRQNHLWKDRAKEIAEFIYENSNN